MIVYYRIKFQKLFEKIKICNNFHTCMLVSLFLWHKLKVERGAYTCRRSECRLRFARLKLRQNAKGFPSHPRSNEGWQFTAGSKFLWHWKSRDFHEKLTFLEHAQDASTKLLGCVGSDGECFPIVQGFILGCLKCVWKFRKFRRFLVVQLFGGCRSTVRVPTQYACNRAGYVDRGGEGSTGPSRGEHRSTVYRAHVSISGWRSEVHVGQISFLILHFFAKI